MNTSPIRKGNKASFNMNQFFDNANFAPKIPIPPVSNMLTNPNTDIKFLFFLFK